jgi:ppGpp synthetase/RelA/SpoT-type nucleotidyltranferase
LITTPKNKKGTVTHREGYSKKDVQRAGETLIIPNIVSIDSKKHLDALMVLSYWRSCHIVPLDRVINILTNIVPRIDNTAIVAKRLKRAQSIIEKLTRNQSMKLRNMQDIGGARVICRSIRYINKIKRELTKVADFKVTDYIASPKDDGYRGIHLIGKFTGSDLLDAYSIEIQLRTVRMHSWATSVEIIDLFTKQSLKQGQGKPQWREFFRHASLVLAAMDGVNISKENYDHAAAAVVNLSRKLDIFAVFEAFSDSLKLVGEYGISDREGYYLIQINTVKKTVKCNFYGVEAYDRAVADYLRHESAITDQTAKVVALVSTLPIKDLKEAYPNYFADSADFLESIREVHEKFRSANPNWLRRFFENLVVR